jgi:hypothetical protein
MRALETMREVIALCNAGEGCPCETLSHVTSIPGMREALHQGVAEMGGAAELLLAGAEEEAIRHAGHVLTIAVTVGYMLGSGDAFSTVLASEVTVPDNLAALDFLEGA